MNSKPSLLLHSCCAPCSSSVIEQLEKSYSITVFYYNPNIYPLDEYKRRLAEQKKFLKSKNIPMIEAPYQPQEFFDAVKGLENLPERSTRCFNCYRLRLQKTKDVATQKGFDFFTTTLSVSPHKNADWLNQIGKSLSTAKTKYLPANFKKQNGYLRSLQLSKTHGFYRQTYCGCCFSLPTIINKVENPPKI